MSILNSDSQYESSKAEKLAKRAIEIKRFAKRAYEDISRIQKMGIDRLWNDRELTPQEIIDALGEDAVKVFQYHAALTEYLVALATAEGIEPDIKFPTNAFTIDGNTITVTEDPYILQ